jgi:hypothetical protein
MPVSMKFSPPIVRSAGQSGYRSQTSCFETSGSGPTFMTHSPFKGSTSFGEREKEQQRVQQAAMSRLAGHDPTDSFSAAKPPAKSPEAAAQSAQFIALRVSEHHDNNKMVKMLSSGSAKVGRGMSSQFLRGRYVHGQPLEGLNPGGGSVSGLAVVTDAQLRMDDPSLAPTSWGAQLAQFAQMAQIGCVVLAGTPESFAAWARDEDRRSMIAGVVSSELRPSNRPALAPPLPLPRPTFCLCERE